MGIILHYTSRGDWHHLDRRHRVPRIVRLSPQKREQRSEKPPRNAIALVLSEHIPPETSIHPQTMAIPIQIQEPVNVRGIRSRQRWSFSHGESSRHSTRPYDRSPNIYQWSWKRNECFSNYGKSRDPGGRRRMASPR